MFVVLQLLGLALQLTMFTIRLCLELLVLAGKLSAWLYREVLVPGIQASASALMQLASAVAAYRSSRRWTSSDAESFRRMQGRGDWR